MKDLIRFYSNYSLILLFILMLSCSKTDKETNNQSLNYHQNTNELNTEIRDKLNLIGEELRKQNKTFASQKTVMNIVDHHLKEESFYEDFYNNYTVSLEISKSKTASDSLYDNLSSDVLEIINLINYDLQASSTPEEFNLYLDELQEEVKHYAIETSEKEFLLHYINTYSTSVEFMQNNIDVLINEENQKASSWWDSWGKCASGIVGNAILGGLSGAGIGTVVPGVGTTAGAVIGAIGGGISGASSSC